MKPFARMFARGLGCIAGALVLTLSGCGSDKAPKIQTLQVWTHWEGRELDILKDEIAGFEKSNEGVRVELTTGTFDTFSQQVEHALRTGAPAAPDVFTGINDWIGNFAEKNLVLAIDNLPNELPEEFLSYTYESARYKGKLYAFPVSYECIALFYNRALVKSAPAAFSEWIKTAKSLTHPDRDQWGLVYDLALPYLSMPWLAAEGEPLLRSDGQPLLNTPGKIRWLERVGSFQNALGVVPPRVNRDTSPGQALQERARDVFAAGKAAFYIGGPWDIPPLQAAGIDFAVARLPKMPNGRWSRPLIGVKGIFLTGKGDRKATRDLIRFLGRASLQRRFAIETARIPSLKIIYEDPVILKNKPLIAFAQQASVGEAMPNAPEIFAVWRPLQDLAFVPFLEGRVTAAQGLDAAQKAAEEEIRRYRAELATW